MPLAVGLGVISVTNLLSKCFGFSSSVVLVLRIKSKRLDRKGIPNE